MDFSRHRSFRLLCALFAFFVVGDIVADGLHDASGLCMTESQDAEHDSCPACGCSIHTGSALALEAMSCLPFASEASGRVATTDDRAALGAPPAIDHPPQLS